MSEAPLPTGEVKERKQLDQEGEGQERSCETDRGGSGNEIVKPTEEVKEL